ncbi:MAG: hypothetical protein JJD92_07510 [Frankiaceae bacterium]|nr:hypothetical protein [Frankiaceae bacterium]
MRRPLTVLGAALAVLAAGACGSSDTTGSDVATPSANQTTNPTAAGIADGKYVENGAEFVDAADWDTRATVRIEMGEMFFTPKNVTLAAGKPYVLELVNTGKVKHEFAAGAFFRSAATRKMENAGAEVKAPFFTEIEVFAGKTVELFVIPVLPGTFEMLCEIAGHREAGMEGSITVTGTAPAVPAPVVGDLTAGKWIQNGPALVEAANWDAKKTIRVEAGENGAKMFFEPKNLTMKAGTPYVLELVNVGKVKHEYTAAEFFPTAAFRKAEDAIGEYKAPRLNEAEVLPGKQLDLYLIPTKAGTFEIVCEIEGHRAAGMFGTITVLP